MDELKGVLPYFRPYRRALGMGLVLVVVANAFSIAKPYLMKLAIDALGDPGVTSGRILAFAGALVGAALLGGAARYGMRELLNGLSRRMECDLRNDFFGHLLRLEPAFHASIRTGDLMSRATNDTQAVRQAVGPAVMYTVNTAVSFTFALSLMLWISPRLTLYALLPMLLLPPVAVGFGRIIHARFETIQEQFSTLSTLVQENLTGVRIVRAYGREESEARRFEAMNREYMARNMDLVKAAGLFHPLLTLLSGLAMVAVLWFGGREVMAGRITVGDFVAFGFYVALLTWPLIALGWVVNLYQRGAASMGRLNRILEREPEIAPAPDAVPFEGFRGEVEFRDVSFRYPGTERWVLREISFRVEAGERVAVVGPTGAGKTTLLSLIPRLYDPQRGEVRIDGVPVDRYDPGALRRRIGMVPQDPFLFSDTLEENLALGLEPGGDGDRIRAASRVAQLHEAVEAFPRGYETYLGERGINLSGGQKQRATLARALAREPEILILDDALSAVDTRTEARILDHLDRVLEGRTSFLISHRVSAVMGADRILVLDDGELVEEGTHEELVARGGTYATLLRRQMLEEEVEASTPV